MFPRLPILFVLLLCLVVCECLAVAGPPAREAAPRRDRYGDPLPPGAIARLGTTRFRTNARQTEIVLTPDGKLLALADDRCLRLVSASTGEEIRSIKLEVDSEGERVGTVRFSPDGKRFAVFGAFNGIPPAVPPASNGDYVIVGEVAGGKILHRFALDCLAVAFAPDGQRLFALERKSGDGDGSILCWNLASGKEVWRSSAVGCFVLSPDGKIVAGGEKNGSVRLWDASSGRERRRLDGHGSPIQALAFSPDGRTLVSTSGDPLFGGGEHPPERSVRMWDVSTGKQRYRCKDDVGDETVIRFAPDGRTFATIKNERRSLHLWHAASGALLQYFPGEEEPDKESPLFAFVFSPDGKMLFYQCQQDRMRTIYQWDIFAGKEVRHWDMEASDVSDLAVSPDGKRLFVLGDDLRIWDLTSGAELHKVPAHRTAVVSLMFSPDGRRLASQDYRLECRQWDARTGAPLACDSSHRGPRVYLHAFRGDGRSFITLKEDATVGVWDTAREKEVRRFRVGGRLDRRMWRRILDPTLVWSDYLIPASFKDSLAAFHARKNLLAVFGADQHIHLWDTASGEELRVLNGHRGELLSLVFSSQGNLLLSHGRDATLRLWDVVSGGQLLRITTGRGASRHHFSLSSDERLLAWAEADGDAIHLWDVAARKEVRRLRGHRGGTEQVQFDGDGMLLASYGKDRAVRLWDVKTGVELYSIMDKGADPSVVLYSCPDGRLLARGFFKTEDVYQLRDLSTGQDLCEAPPPHDDSIARLAPDSRTLAVCGARLIFRERATGGILAEMPPGHGGRATCLAFSPDGKYLATGGQDSTILVWDWQRLAGLRRPAGTRIEDRELQAAWTDLAAKDARKGYRAIGTLIAGGDKSVSLLRARLRPAAAEDWQKVRRLLDKLDDDDFTVREKASQDLLRRGPEARLFLCRASKERVSLETRRRLEQILDNPEMSRPTSEAVRTVRAVQVLEGIGSPAARDLLTLWSGGDTNAWLTQEAKAALQRLARRAEEEGKEPADKKFGSAPEASARTDCPAFALRR